MTLNPRLMRHLLQQAIPMTDHNAPRDLFRLHPAPDGTVVELLLPEMMDSLELDRLNEALLAAVAAAPAANWVLDLAGTAYMGSAVLGLLVNVRHQIKSAGGRLALCSLSPTLLGIFHASSLHRLFTIYAARPDALASLSRR